MPLFIGSMFVKFRNHLEKLILYGIYPKLDDNETIMDILDVAYIQPFFQIYREHIEKRTGHQVSFNGNGQQNVITYQDTGAYFSYEILEYGNSDIPFYYENATNDEAIELINILETIYATHRFINIGEVAEENNRKTLEWLDSIRDSTDDDYTDDEDEELWMEYMSEIHEGFEEWKAKRKPKPKGPDINAGTIAWFDGEHWNQLNGISNVEVQMDEPATFYADDKIYYNFEPNYEISFTCDNISEAFKKLADNLTVQLKKFPGNSVPP